MFIATGRSERNAAATAAPPIASAVNIFINTAYEYENNVHKCESTLNVRRFMASWQIAVRSEKKYHENTRRKCAEKAVEKEPDTTRVSAAIAIQMQTRQMSVKVARNLHTNLNHFVEPLSASVSASVSARVSVSMSVVCLCVRITRANNISHINSHFNQFACNLRGWHNPRPPSLPCHSSFALRLPLATTALRRQPRSATPPSPLSACSSPTFPLCSLASGRGGCPNAFCFRFCNCSADFCIFKRRE